MNVIVEFQYLLSFQDDINLFEIFFHAFLFANGFEVTTFKLRLNKFNTFYNLQIFISKFSFNVSKILHKKLQCDSICGLCQLTEKITKSFIKNFPKN